MSYQPRNPMHLRLPKPVRIRLTEEQRQKCARCGLTRYDHTREGLGPDHDFEGESGQGAGPRAAAGKEEDQS